MMASRSFLRALLVGACVMLVLVGAYIGWRALGDDPVSPPLPAFDPADFVAEPVRLDAPFVATDYEVVDAMLAMARVRPNDYVIDLGSGDGRILIAAARSHGARGLGVDIDPERIEEAQANAQAARVGGMVEFRRQDLFETPIAQADVLTLYLTQEVNLRLRPRILSQMRPGTRVVSHDYGMGDWAPDAQRKLGTASLYLWIVPGRVAGNWQLTGPEGKFDLRLEQRFQRIGGLIENEGSATRIEQGRLRGNLVSFVATVAGEPKRFEGRIQGGRIEPVNLEDEWRLVRTG